MSVDYQELAERCRDLGRLSGIAPRGFASSCETILAANLKGPILVYGMAIGYGDPPKWKPWCKYGDKPHFCMSLSALERSFHYHTDRAGIYLLEVAIASLIKPKPARF